MTAVALASSLTGGARADVILDWNLNALEVIRTAQIDGSAKGPGDISRALAMTQAAVFEAVNSIDRAYQPYQNYVQGAAGASPVAAAAQAAHDVLTELFPGQEDSLADMLAVTLSTVGDDGARVRGIELGRSAAHQLVALRDDDGAVAALNAPYIPNGNVEDWQPTLPDERAAYSPGWGMVTPFAVPDVTAYRNPPPPRLDSAAYTAAFDEVKALGSLNSTTRTSDQTQAGLFWAYDRAQMGTPINLYNKIAQVVAIGQDNSVEENARLFALINLAMADAGISAWDTKYTYDFWRPITAIREGDADGNASTIEDEFWVPLGAPGGDPMTSCEDLSAEGCDDFSPPFPAYTSGHSTFGAALFETLTLFFESDDISFTFTSEELFEGEFITRTFASFSQAAAENGRSRIYLGVHWAFDDIFEVTDPELALIVGEDGRYYAGGQPAGRAIANYVFSNALLPLPVSPSAVLFVAGLAGLAGLGWLGRRDYRGCHGRPSATS